MKKRIRFRLKISGQQRVQIAASIALTAAYQPKMELAYNGIERVGAVTETDHTEDTEVVNQAE